MGTRIQQEPGYILHHRPFRDASQILDILTRDHGKIAVVARGSRGAKSRLAGVLRPFLPLRVSWVAKSDLGTLTGAEAAGRPAGLHGDALLAAYYVNELVMHFLLRHDPQPEIYALYSDVVGKLDASSNIGGTLRRFELEFLGLLGYAVSVDRVAGSDESIDVGRHYEYRAEQGPVPVERTSGELVFDGATLLAIGGGRFDEEDVLKAAGRLLRSVIQYYLGGKELQTRKVLRDVHRGRIAAPEERNP